jgi:hypothetical protein
MVPPRWRRLPMTPDGGWPLQSSRSGRAFLPASERQLGRFCPQCQDPLMDPVLGAARHPGRTIAAPGQTPDSAVTHLPAQCVRHRLRRSPTDVKVVIGQRIEQLRDCGCAVNRQVVCQRVAELGSSQPQRLSHAWNVASRYDIRGLVARRRAKRGPGQRRQAVTVFSERGIAL